MRCRGYQGVVKRFVGLPEPPSRRPGLVYLICPRCNADFLGKFDRFKQKGRGSDPAR
jgi:hypothetical protein